MKQIGFDVGGVIIPKASANSEVDTDLRNNEFLLTQPAQGAFDTIRLAVARFGADNIFIISKCGELMERRARWWLVYQDFYRRTGFNYNNLHFCEKRPQKAPIAKSLGLTDFVDDKADVLEHMKRSVSRLYLFGQQPEGQNAEGLIAVQDWDMLRTHILPARKLFTRSA